MPNELETVSRDYIALQVTSIRRDGINKNYSNKKGVPAYLYKGKNNDYPKLLNADGRAFIDRKIKEGKKYGVKGSGKFSKFKATSNDRVFVANAISTGFVNWKQIRQAQGLQTAFVDLSYSNDMLNHLGVIRKEITNAIFKVVIGGVTESSRKKMGYNFKRYGNFMYPNQAIQSILMKSSGLRISNFIKNQLGAVKI